MKEPDEATMKMLQEELNRIMDEVNDSSSSLAEQNKVTTVVMEITINLMGRGISASIHRKVFEILYRYYCLIEGLAKK